MNLNTLKYFIVLLLTICSLNASRSYGQETVNIKTLSTKTTYTRLKLETEKEFSVFSFGNKTTQNYNTKIHTTNNLKNFPFQFGLEYGTAVKIKNKKIFKLGYWFFANLNLYDKRVFLKSECGSLKLNEDLGSNASYFFLGFSGIPFVYKNHKLSFSLGSSFYNSEQQKGLAFAGSMQYLFSLNKYLSFIVGLNLPTIRKAKNNEYYHNPMITIGFQIF